MALGPGNLWDAAVGEPYVELLDENGAVVGAMNLNIPHATHITDNIACLLVHGHIPVRTTVELADGKLRDVTMGFRYRAHLYYAPTNKTGRSICAVIINHLAAHTRNTVKFYPRRDNTAQWHWCKLDEDPDIDKWVENRALGYELALSLVGVLREPQMPDETPSYITDFNDVTLIYIAGDHVRNWGDVTAAYLVTDFPGYFSEYIGHGTPGLPPY